jgi:hypothetical protein
LAVQRNLDDASLRELSADNRFGLAYEATFLIAKMAVAAAGYRVKGIGAHRTMFLSLGLALPRASRANADYFDRCRRKRNDLHYEVAGIATESESAELLREAVNLQKLVENWIDGAHPRLRRGFRRPPRQP